MLDTIEAFIAETYVQLATTKSMCCSTDGMCTGQMLKYKCIALYCAFPYIADCIDVSGMVLSGPFNRPTANRAQVKGDLNTKCCIRAGF